MTRSKVCLLPLAGLLWLASLNGAAQVPAAESSESYYVLATSLQQQERHFEAIEAFDNALQLLRENTGLNALEQLPILQARLESSETLAAWEDVDAGKQLAYLVVAKNPSAGAERR